MAMKILSIKQDWYFMATKKEWDRITGRQALKNEHSRVIISHMKDEQKSALIIKIDMNASVMRRLGKYDDTETLNGSDSLVTAHLEKRSHEERRTIIWEHRMGA